MRLIWSTFTLAFAVYAALSQDVELLIGALMIIFATVIYYLTEV